MVSVASPPWDRVFGTPCHVTFVYQSIAWNFSKINLKRTFFNCSSDTSASADHRHEWRYTKCSITLHYITLQYLHIAIFPSISPWCYIFPVHLQLDIFFRISAYRQAKKKTSRQNWKQSSLIGMLATSRWHISKIGVSSSWEGIQQVKLFRRWKILSWFSVPSSAIGMIHFL